jgi:alpha-glucosidase
VVNSPVLDRDEVQDIYREWRRVMDEYDRDVMAVAEAWLPPERAARYVAPDTLHQVFNFDFMGVAWDARRLATVITDTMAGLAEVGAPPTWALSNHDTPRVVTRLGGGTEGLSRARALAAVAHVLPGAVYVYQGEELGLPDAPVPDDRRQDPVFHRTHGEQKGRDGARVPLPWSGAEPPYGFGGAGTWLPQPDGWSDRTVAAQATEPGSTLALYRRLLLLRHAHPGLAAGQPCSVDVRAGDVLEVRRGAGLVCLVNLGGTAVRVADLVPGPTAVLVATDDAVGEDLPPGTGVWLQA